ncbi:MAG TPA: Rrf2 family transcriptional regulator [Planctomycetota bacterium]|jgi:Rrf2 family protein
MLFSKATGYAIRATAYLAAQPPGSICGAREIANHEGIPPLFLRKILSELCRHRILRSSHGIHGGYALARSAENISLWELVQALEKELDWELCVVGTTACTNETPSGVDEEIHRISRQVIELLRSRKMADFARAASTRTAARANS